MKAERSLQFATTMEGEAPSARCSICHRIFIAKARDKYRMADMILQIMKEFEQHKCHVREDRKNWLHF